MCGVLGFYCWFCLFWFVLLLFGGVLLCSFVLNSDPKLLLLFLHICIVVHSIFIHRGLSQVETETTTNIRKPLINSAASIDRRNPLLTRHQFTQCTHLLTQLTHACAQSVIFIGLEANPEPYQK